MIKINTKMEREKITLSVSELRDVTADDSDVYTVIKSETTGHWRHGSEETAIVQRVSDGKFFQINYRDSVKESCEFSDMNDGGDYSEVFPEKVETIVYK